MRTLSLVNQDNSEIKFKIASFPDGQQDVMILEKDNFNITDWNYPTKIKARLNNFKDLELIVCATLALKGLGVKEIHLFTPYILGARSDRKFVKGGTSYLRDVIAPIINSMRYESVTCIDPHSDVLCGCINNVEPIDNLDLVDYAIEHIEGIGGRDIAIVSPDGGALKKIFDVVKYVSTIKDVSLIQSAKHRDIKTGQLVGFSVPITESDKTKDLVWVDDICDGGGTFVGEAVEANKMGHTGRKFLIVTHGLFTQGLDILKEYFDGIFCTDSYKTISSNISINLKGEKFYFYQKPVF